MWVGIMDVRVSLVKTLGTYLFLRHVIMKFQNVLGKFMGVPPTGISRGVSGIGRFRRELGVTRHSYMIRFFKSRYVFGTVIPVCLFPVVLVVTEFLG